MPTRVTLNLDVAGKQLVLPYFECIFLSIFLHNKTINSYDLHSFHACESMIESLLGALKFTATML